MSIPGPIRVTKQVWMRQCATQPLSPRQIDSGIVLYERSNSSSAKVIIKDILNKHQSKLINKDNEPGNKLL
jgi:hypothetical protein